MELKLNRSIFKNKTVRMLLLFYLLLIVSSLFLILFSYYRELVMMEEQRIQRLKGIVTTLAVQANAQEHENVIRELMNYRDETIAKDARYIRLKEPLKKAYEANNLQTPIYTLFYHKASNTFCYGVRSDDKIYIYDEYKKFPKALLHDMDEGGVLTKYASENGTWISAFHPIKDSSGKVVALIEADEEFSGFLATVNKQLVRNVFLELFGILLISSFFFPLLRRIFRRDQLLMIDLARKKEHLQEILDDTAASLRYASTVQKLLLPTSEEMKIHFKDHFVLYLPKDEVSGDFYWVRKNEHFTYFAVADCTGHGIPGAILSVLGINILNNIYGQNPYLEPDEMIERLDKELNALIGHSKGDLKVRDGMEIALVQVDSFNHRIKFAGAGMDLVVASNVGIEKIKGSSASIGATDEKQVKYFEVHEMNIEKGSFYYLFSDGFKDQFGGEANKKYTIKRLLKDIASVHKKDATSQKVRFEEILLNWKQDNKQTDDILFIGFSGQ